MIKQITTIIIGLAVTVSSWASARESRESTPPDAKTYHLFQPCTSWRPSNQGYLCNYPEMSIRVPDINEIDALKRRVAELESQIAALISRIEKLENSAESQ